MTFAILILTAAYVREWRKDGNHTQPCERLASRGYTLMCDGHAGLAHVIRREYRAMRRAETIRA